MATERIYALFQDVADAERAIGAVADRGISRDAIGVVARRPAEQDEAGRVRTDFTRLTDHAGMRQGEPEAVYVAQPGTLPPAALSSTLTPMSAVDTPDNVATVGKEGLTTTTPQDAAAGAAVGSGVGLVAGLLLAAAAIAVPGVGLVLGGGALAAALGAAAATTAAGAVAGGVTGYLRDMGMPEQAAQRIADRLHEGDYLVTIDADTSQYDDLKMLLTKYNAVGIDTDTTLPNAGIPPASTPPVVIAPRYPMNPALAQETEPVVVTNVVPAGAAGTMRAPGLTPDEEMAQVEQARTTEREIRDATT